MAQINKPDEYFTTFLWTGDGASTRSITGVGLQADMMWSKIRNVGHQHNLVDTVRGVNQRLLSSNDSGAEDTTGTQGYFNSLDSDGFSLTYGGAGGYNTNRSGDTYVGWFWKAGGSASSNSDGTITSSVSANTTSGFSIVTWTGDGNKSATVGHGLGSELSCIIIKERTGGDWWHNWQTGLSGDSYNMFFNNDQAERSAYNDGHVKKLNNTTTFGFDSSTSNVNAVNQSGVDNVGYCFAEKKGFSKFGKYIGNGSSDGAYVYTGFKPAMMIIKKIDGVEEWGIYDNKRDPFNVADHRLFPNLSDSESTSTDMLDFTSNGFKCRTSNNMVNANTGEYVYMAFAENPFVTSTGISGLAG